MICDVDLRCDKGSNGANEHRVAWTIRKLNVKQGYSMDGYESGGLAVSMDNVWMQIWVRQVELKLHIGKSIA
jgi:hypothetical protein